MPCSLSASSLWSLLGHHGISRKLGPIWSWREPCWCQWKLLQTEPSRGRSSSCAPVETCPNYLVFWFCRGEPSSRPLPSRKPRLWRSPASLLQLQRWIGFCLLLFTRIWGWRSSVSRLVSQSVKKAVEKQVNSKFLCGIALKNLTATLQVFFPFFQTLMSVCRTRVMVMPTAPTWRDPTRVSVFLVSKATGSTAPSQVASTNTLPYVLFFGITIKIITHILLLSFSDPSPLHIFNLISFCHYWKAKLLVKKRRCSKIICL